MMKVFKTAATQFEACSVEPVWNEAELLNRAREGDSEASQKVFSTYLSGSEMINRLLKKTISDPEERKDLLHEIYVRLITGSSRFRGDSRLSTYVYRVARITILQKFRSENTFKRGKIYRFISDTFEVPGNPQFNPEFIYTVKEVRRILEELIDRLPEPYREATRLRVLEDYTYDEISRKMNIALSTVSTRIHKGKKILVRFLRTDFFSDRRANRLYTRSL